MSVIIVNVIIVNVIIVNVIIVILHDVLYRIRRNQAIINLYFWNCMG